jgi:hypothetical protein
LVSVQHNPASPKAGKPKPSVALDAAGGDGNCPNADGAANGVDAAGTPAAGADAGLSLGTGTNTNISSMIPMLQNLMSMLFAMIQSMTGSGTQQGQNPFNLPTTAAVSGVTAASATGAATTGQPAGVVSSGPPIIMQLDDFVTDAGNTNEQILSSGGAQIIPINVNKDTTQSRATSVAQGLDQVLQAVQSGQRVDVVNIQQQDFAPSAASDHIRAVVDQLSNLGIPVVISAGLSTQQNVNGIQNQFGTNNSFNVQPIDELGNFTAVPGNVKQSGTHAPARVSVEIAALKAQGKTLAEIRQALGVSA